ncbi:hypothetical protein KQI49_08830 [Virgibacillus sp. MSJ-26]|uniref:VOC family protein n=1 Tax=Virgibacillus sp. MSJ-26 TaxID=2841522 RepID=UPI001C10BCF4|nr:hypothetical protein [Virgibacillus sp. MSJ-26]MBU5466932.1 hypothetical protein [Virgibacillus sp. MSJ-26]
MREDQNQKTPINNEKLPDVPLIIGIRVQNVEEAIHFYRGIGFKEYMNNPDKHGKLHKQ